MIKHIVLYKFTDNITEDIINKIIERFNQCKQKLDGFISLEYGINCSAKIELSNGFNYGVIMIFDNEETIKEYNNLEEHKEAKEIMDKFLVNKLVFDIKAQFITI